MLSHLLASVTGFILQVINSGGYVGIMFLMGLESAAIPLPSEIIMPFSGFLVHAGRFTLLGIALAGAIGSVLGSWLTYFIGKYGGRPLVRKYGHLVFVTYEDLEMVDGFFNRFGHWATFLGRMVPVVRTYISLPAGVTRVKFWQFSVTCFIGSFLWSLFLGWIGLKLAQNWEALHPIFQKVDLLIVLAAVIGITWWVRRHLKNRVK
jgi:membrane protein DedA with SNARE-associated domain